MLNKKSVAVMVLASLFALSGCQTTRINAATGEEETSATTQGALVGCVGGAIAGALIKDGKRGKGAAIGCAGGAAVGGAIGYNLDQQEAELRKVLVGTGVQVQRNGDTIRLIMADSITFSTASAMLNPSIKGPLKSVALVMDRYESSRLVVAGHTDSQGDANYNMQLSQSRAQAVANQLMVNGVEPSRLIVQGFGENMPVCSNKTAAGRACNRRVELDITAK